MHINPCLPAELLSVESDGHKTPLPGEWVFPGQPKLPPGAPQHIVIPTADLIDEFEINIGPGIHPRDVDEILACVIQALLLEENQDDIEMWPALMPDFNRMRSTAFFKEEGKAQIVRTAGVVLAIRLRERLQQLLVYYRGEFPYYFERFVGKDIIVQQLPHS